MSWVVLDCRTLSSTLTSEKFPPGCFYSSPHSVTQFSIAVGNSQDSQVTYKEKRFILVLGVGGLGQCLAGHIAVVR